MAEVEFSEEVVETYGRRYQRAFAQAVVDNESEVPDERKSATYLSGAACIMVAQEILETAFMVLEREQKSEVLEAKGE
jgi:hypothetical protein